MTTLQRAEAAEHEMSQELDRVVVKSAIYMWRTINWPTRYL